MKKFLLLLLSLIFVLSCSSCDSKRNKWGGGGSGGGGGISSIVNAPQQTKRTVDISEGILADGLEFEYSYDFDFDNQNEDIALHVTEGMDENEEYYSFLNVVVGEKSTIIDIYDGYIEKVYFCDIDTTDNAGDIAIITTEGSGDPRIRILSYTNNLKAYKFVSDNSYDSGDINNSNWLGYACSFYFNVNNDDTITLEEQTTSTGMWSVLKNYKRNPDGMFEEIRPEKYEILPDFMENQDIFSSWEDLPEEETEMWKRGYVQAKISWPYGDIAIEEGEYFKPLYDDGNNNLYVETQSGDAGWIEIKNDYDVYSSELNPMFFFLAG